MAASSEADDLLRRMAEHGVETTDLDRAAAFAEACRATIRPGEVLVAPGSPPAFVYVPMGPGLVVRPHGGYAPSPLPAVGARSARPASSGAPSGTARSSPSARSTWS